MGVFGLVAPIAMTYAFLWLAFTLPVCALRHERRFFLWHLHLRIPGATGIGSASHPGRGVRSLLYLLAPSDIGLGIPELSADRSSLLTMENGEDVRLLASRTIVRHSVDRKVSNAICYANGPIRVRLDDWVLDQLAGGSGISFDKEGN